MQLYKLFARALKLACLVILLHGQAQAESIMSIGHSLLGYPQMPAALNALAADGGFTITANKTQNNPGASLNYNYNNSSASHNDDFRVEFTTTSGADFDIMIITEGMPIQPQQQFSEGHRYANLFYEAAIAENPNMNFFLWQTWDCRLDNTDNCPSGRADNGLIGQIVDDRSTWEGYAEHISSSNSGATINIIPGGEALIALNTAIEAGQVDGISNISQIFSDFIHLNTEGWYFMALVNYATIFKVSPEGLTSNIPSHPHSLSVSAVSTMQRIAWETVCDYSRSGVDCNGTNPPTPISSRPASPTNLQVAILNSSGSVSSTDTSSAETTQTNTAPSDTSPTDTASTDTASTDTASTDTASTDTASTDSTSTDTTPTDTTPTDTAQSNSNQVGQMPEVEGCAIDRKNALAAAPSNPYFYNGTAKMGSNLTYPAYWQSNYPFIDLRRQSDHINRGEFASWNLINGSGAMLDQHNNIIALSSGSVQKGLIGDSGCIYGGDYVVLWDQQNSPSVSLSYSGSGTLALTQDESSIGRRVYTLSLPENMTRSQYESSGMSVSIDAPITGYVDWHVILPGQEAAHHSGELFNPDFIDDLRGNKVLRFMDWAATNNSTKRNIEDFTSMSSDTWAYDKGVPYSVMMQLVKQTEAPIAWLTIPHLATQETMVEIARQIYAEWEPGITVYIEWSNEVWNSIFEQTNYADIEGKAAFPAISSEGGSAMSVFYAQKSLEMKAAFTTVFDSDADAIKLVVAGHIDDGGYQNPNRAVCYSGCRVGNTYNDIASEIDIYAVAPYLSGLQGPGYAEPNNVQLWTDQQLFDYNYNGVGNEASITQIISQMNNNKSMLAYYSGRTDVEYAAYEFGQHMTASHDQGGPLDLRYQAFQRSEAMGNLYHDLIQAMIDAGMDAVANYDSHGRHTQGMYWGSKQGIAGDILLRHQAVEAAY